MYTSTKFTSVKNDLKYDFKPRVAWLHQEVPSSNSASAGRNISINKLVANMQE